MGQGAAGGAMTFGALGVAGAFVLSAALRIGCMPHDNVLSLCLFFLVPAAMALTGAILGASTARMTALNWGLFGVVLLPMMGCGLGGLIALVCWMSFHAAAIGARDGLAFGGAALAATAPALPLLRRTLTARPRSLTARTRFAVLACGLALALEMAIAMAFAGPVEFRHCDPSSTPAQSYPWLALLGVIVAVAGFAATVVRAAMCRSALALAIEPSDPRMRAWRQFDLGLGHGLHSPRAREGDSAEGPYRQTLARDAVVIGDPVLAHRSLAMDVPAAFFCAAAAVVLGVSLFALASAFNESQETVRWSAPPRAACDRASPSRKP